MMVFRSDGLIEYIWTGRSWFPGPIRDGVDTDEATYHHTKPKSRLVLWSPVSDEVAALEFWHGEAEGAVSGSWSPSGDRIASYVTTEKVVVWDATSGEALVTRNRSAANVHRESCISWSPKGDRIALCGAELVVVNCPFCNEYPCDWILGLAKGYTMMLEDGKRMKEIGLDKWVEEQEARKTTGFVYTMIRCHPYTVP